MRNSENSGGEAGVGYLSCLLRKSRSLSVLVRYQGWRTVILTLTGRFIVWVAWFHIALSHIAAAQSWVEERNYLSQHVLIYRVDGLLAGKVKGPIGDFVWFQTDRSYSEAYAGPSLTLKKWLVIAAGVGAEQSKHPGRLGSFIWAGNDRMTMVAVYENGGSGYWYKVEGNLRTNSHLGVGFLSERFHGTGPRVECGMSRSGSALSRVRLWVAPLADGGKIQTAFGIRMSF
jgi:hypothetical protein